MPFSVTVCGEPLALSVTVRVTGVTAPVTVGVNVTAMVQFVPAATGVAIEQVLLGSSAKVVPPGIEIALIVSAAVPVLETVIV